MPHLLRPLVPLCVQLLVLWPSDDLGGALFHVAKQVEHLAGLVDLRLEGAFLVDLGDLLIVRLLLAELDVLLVQGVENPACDD